MTDYTLYYWPLPFRGQLIRWVMAHAGATWHEAEMQSVADLRAATPDTQPAPFMAPPMLQDHEAQLWFAQMPAILLYLGERHGLMPDTSALRAATLKIVADANDVLNDLTRGGGAVMWDTEAWATTGRPRLIRWMEIFEIGAEMHGASVQGGTLLGTEEPGLADVVSAALWHTMTTRLPPLRDLLEVHAPVIAAHTDGLADTPTLAGFDAGERARLGDVYCGGQIETSLREVLGMKERESHGPI